MRHSLAEARAFDLHVLGMPPAFVLSQDQTLMFNPHPPPTEDRCSKGLTTLTPRRNPHLSAQTTPLPRERLQSLPPPAHPFLVPTLPISNRAGPKAHPTLPRIAADATISPRPGRRDPLGVGANG